MDLHILYQCPNCNQKTTHNLADLAPGRQRDCLDCGVPVGLTDESLIDLQKSLREACRH
jgi:hypothetical protein